MVISSCYCVENKYGIVDAHKLHMAADIFPFECLKAVKTLPICTWTFNMTKVFSYYYVKCKTSSIAFYLFYDNHCIDLIGVAILIVHIMKSCQRSPLCSPICCSFHRKKHSNSS